MFQLVIGHLSQDIQALMQKSSIILPITPFKLKLESRELQFLNVGEEELKAKSLFLKRYRCESM